MADAENILKCFFPYTSTFNINIILRCRQSKCRGLLLGGPSHIICATNMQHGKQKHNEGTMKAMLRNVLYFLVHFQIDTH